MLAFCLFGKDNTYMTIEFNKALFDFAGAEIPAHIEHTPERLEERRKDINIDPNKFQVRRVDANGSEPFASEIDDLETAEILREALIRSSTYFKLVDVVIERPIDRRPELANS